MSHVTYHVSLVMCHMSHVKKQNKKKNIIRIQKKCNLQIKLDKVVELGGGGSVINGAYPV